jgi:hypothetical protein
VNTTQQPWRSSAPLRTALQQQFTQFLLLRADTPATKSPGKRVKVI